MGQYLSSPITDKEIVAGQAEHVLGRIDYAVASHQGWRRSQEDAHVAVQLTNEHLLFGVYDGHGGHEVARFCSLVMPKELPTLESFLEEDYARSLITVFHLMDEKLRQGEEHGDGNRANQKRTSDDAFGILRKVINLQNKSDERAVQKHAGEDLDVIELPESQAGCTAVVALLHRNHLYVANAGDSRAILCRNGKAVPLSIDHKPSHLTERERVVAAGGFISDIGGVCRVNGNLSLSRAIGDLRYKTNHELAPSAQIITAEPDIEQVTLSTEDHFFVLACDGIWDVLTNQEVVDFVRNGLSAGKTPSEVASNLLDRCLASDPRETRGIGCDNMTACIVVINHEYNESGKFNPENV